MPLVGETAGSEMQSASVSTHVLDAAAGGPRPGIRVDLYDGAGDLIATGATDDHGRIQELASALAPGRYLVTWHLGGHFVSDVSATIHLAGGHHHVPLLATGASTMLYLGA